MSRSTWNGFDYVAQKALTLPRKEWRARCETAVKAGGRVERRAGEMFIHGKDGLIAAEIYVTDDELAPSPPSA